MSTSYCRYFSFLDAKASPSEWFIVSDWRLLSHLQILRACYSWENRGWNGRKWGRNVSPRISSFWSVCKLEDQAELSFLSRRRLIYVVWRQPGFWSLTTLWLVAPLGALSFANFAHLFQPPHHWAACQSGWLYIVSFSLHFVTRK